MTADPGDFFRGVDEGAAHHQQRHAAPNGSAGAFAPLALIDPTSLSGVPVPPRQWLVPDWVPMVRVTGIYGPGGEGKTTLAQMLGTSCAIGAQWLGLPVLRCNSVLAFCEDDPDEMHRRQEDINRHYGCDFADIGAMRWLPRLGADNALMDGAGQHTPFFFQLLAAVKDHVAQLVIVDTLADVFVGSENDRGQSRAFAQQVLGRLAREAQAAVIALAHPSRAGMSSGTGDSGSTGWQGTFRSHLYLATPTDDDGSVPNLDMRTLTRKKANAARRNETIELRWRDGVFVTTAPPTGIIASIERHTCERVFLDLLDRTTEENQPVSSNSHSGTFAPKLFASRPDREGYGKADFQRAMQSLFAQKKITNAPYGRKGDERNRIARAE